MGDMGTEVKPGQVWQNKNMGSRWTVVRADGDHWVLRDGDTHRIIPEHILFDDYVMVKEAP